MYICISDGFMVESLRKERSFAFRFNQVGATDGACQTFCNLNGFRCNTISVVEGMIAITANICLSGACVNGHVSVTDTSSVKSIDISSSGVGRIIIAQVCCCVLNVTSACLQDWIAAFRVDSS